MRNGAQGLLCTVLTHHLFFLAAATPLTPEAVTEAVKEADLDQLAWCLYGTSRVDDIKSHYPPEDHRRVLVDWWFSTDPAPSWRRLIYRLDASLFLSTTADKIRHNAEPVQGMLCT